MWKKFLVSAALLFGAVGAANVHAVSFESRDFNALATQAEQVVIGTATTATSRRTGEREIVTDYRFENIEVVKGNVAGNVVTLTLLGGTVGADTMSVGGAPKFVPGVRYLVFVAGNGSVMFPMVGGSQGIFQIRQDPVTGASRVHDYAGRPVTQLPGLKGADAFTNARGEIIGSDPSTAITQESFIAAIKAKVAAQGAK